MPEPKEIEGLKLAISVLHMMARMEHWGACEKRQGKFLCEWKGVYTPQAICALALQNINHLGIPTPHPTQDFMEFNSKEQS